MNLPIKSAVRKISRRDWLRAGLCGGLVAGSSGWLPALAEQVAGDPRRRRHCVLLWMTGGPSQLDTFDLKPGHANGGEFREIATSVPGLRFSEHLPKLAQQADRLALVRALSTKEGDHGRGTHAVRTGHPPGGPVRYPSLPCALGKELVAADASVPSYVSIAPIRAFSPAAFGPGFLGPRYAPLTVGSAETAGGPATGAAEEYAELRVDDLRLPRGVEPDRFAARLQLWRTFQEGFLASHPDAAPAAYRTMHDRALALMNSDVAQAFDLHTESAEIRDAYGRGRFGQGCLLARRLIERGVPFVEVTLGSLGGAALGWDTHQNNFPAVRALSDELDAGWATLMNELAERDLLERTTILWIGEFGRTPRINGDSGRDHFPAAWSCVFAGGGIRGGAIHGRTSADGMAVEENAVGIGDILATLCTALGVPPDHENVSELGRPIRLAEGTPIREIVTGSAEVRS